MAFNQIKQLTSGPSDHHISELRRFQIKIVKIYHEPGRAILKKHHKEDNGEMN